MLENRSFAALVRLAPLVFQAHRLRLRLRGHGLQPLRLAQKAALFLLPVQLCTAVAGNISSQHAAWPG